jgi:chromate transporter
MEDEVVERRRWLTREEFLDLLGAVNVIPGPNSTEMAIHVGLLAGWRGFLIAGICFILPAVAIVTVLAWLYVEFGTLPQAASILRGVKPAVIAVVLQAMWRLGHDSLKTPLQVLVALLSVGLSVLDVHELLVLLVGGIVAWAGWWIARRRKRATPATCLGVLPIAFANAAGGAVAPVSLLSVFLFFLKVGTVLFGSGYVLLAFLRADLVERWHWLDEGQLLDAVAVGQVTPGPLFTTATFIGYLLQGFPGAMVATVGIFLPAFFFVAISGPLVPRLRRSPGAAAILNGVVASSLALMAVVSWGLARGALVDWPTRGLGVISAVLLFRYKVNSAWLVLGGAACGWLFL